MKSRGTGHVFCRRLSLASKLFLLRCFHTSAVKQRQKEEKEKHILAEDPTFRHKSGSGRNTLGFLYSLSLPTDRPIDRPRGQKERKKERNDAAKIISRIFPSFSSRTRKTFVHFETVCLSVWTGQRLEIFSDMDKKAANLIKYFLVLN